MALLNAKLLAVLFTMALWPLFAGCASSTHAPEYTPSTIETQTSAAFLGDGQPALRTIDTDINGISVTLEVADDPDERTRGLSLRDGLPEDGGMLFIWNETSQHTLWMKEMRFALDFIWLDQRRRVVHIEHDVQPQPGAADANLVRYSSQSPAKYAIELTAGDAQRLGVAVGDVLAFDVGED